MTEVATESGLLIRPSALGTPDDRRGALRAILGAGAATSCYVVAANRWGVPPSGLEIFGTATSLASVWLTRSQNIWAIILGLVSVIAMGIFFFDVRLVGQGWLHLGYYIPVQIVGWWAWSRGGERRTELPVGWLSWVERVAISLAAVVGTVAVAALFRTLHGQTSHQLWDASIVAASIAAQLLLTTKRIESWWIWLLPVDVSAILLYLRTDAEMFAVLYVVYLGLAAFGLRDWTRAWHRQQHGYSVAEARRGTPE